MKFLPILLVFLLMSCAQNEWMNFSFNIVNGSEFNETQKNDINKKLLSKIHKFGFREAELMTDKNILNIRVLMNPNSEKEEQNFKAIFESNRLELMYAYDINDSELKGLDTILLKIQNFTPYYNLRHGFYSSKVFGVSNKQKELAKIEAEISEKINHLDNIILYWSKGEIDEKTGNLRNFKLYLIKKPEIGIAKLTEKDLVSIIAKENVTDPSSYLLDFTFNESAAHQWASMTEKAANERNLAIAFIINDKVISTPIVSAPITNGKSSMSGNYTREEAEKLAKSLSIGRLDYELKFIEKTIQTK